jgi:uncharacterized protein with HEPN domain
MQPEVLKYLLDIESIIGEIESLKQRIENSYAQYSTDILVQRALERDLEIIWEAVRRLLAIRPEIKISAAKKIIGLRRIISHAYDSVEPELIWSIIQRDIPVLSEEV